MREEEYFEAIGFLSARDISIEAEVAKGSPSQKFEREYMEITGELALLLPDYHRIEDKWGKELRIYISNIENIPPQLQTSLRIDSYKNYAARINDNNLVTKMFHSGFRIGNIQNLNSIRNSVPERYREDFTRGSNL